MYCSQAYFYCRRSWYSFFKNRLSFPLAPTVETRATELRFSSRCPRRHLVHADLAIAAATVFLDRAAEEQITFYTDCCCCIAIRVSYQITFKRKLVSYELLLVLKQQFKIYLATVQETANSSAWNHISNFQRRGPPPRRARKLLSLCHTHSWECTKEPMSALVAKLWFKGKVRS